MDKHRPLTGRQKDALRVLSAFGDGGTLETTLVHHASRSLLITLASKGLARNYRSTTGRVVWHITPEGHAALAAQVAS